MSAAADDVGIGPSFAAAVGLDGPAAQWAAEQLRLFPVPNVSVAPHLFWSIKRLSESVPWAAEALSAPEFAHYLDVVCDAASAQTDLRPDLFPRVDEDDLRSTFAGAFGLAAAIVGFEPLGQRSPALEALRCALVACRCRWGDRDASRNGAVDDLAMFLRGQVSPALDPADELRLDIVEDLADAATLDRFSDAAAALSTLEHQSLASAWRAHFGPELRGQAQAPLGARHADAFVSDDFAAVGEVVGPLHGAEPRRRRSGKRSSRTDAGREVRSIQRKPFVPDTAATSPFEPATETAVPGFIGALAGGKQDPDAAAVARYRIQQAIRSRNQDLLVEHPDALPLPSYAAAVGGILKLLNDATALEDLRYGACGLLLEALFGRTGKTLTGVEMLADARHSHDPERLDLLVHERAVRLSVYWQADPDDAVSGRVRPSPEQLELVEPVQRDFLLPLAAAFFDALASNAPRIHQLSRTPVARTEARIRQAARHVAKQVGVEFTPGQLRASAAVHLREVCQDSAVVQLICADTLGLSDCPVAYFAPQADALASTFWAFQHRLLGNADDLPLPMTQPHRVGSRLLVRSSTARTLATASSRGLRHGVERLVARGKLQEVHRGMVNQLTCMLVAGATHRPAQSLLELTLADVWVDGPCGAALFADKKIDVAHDPRLVVLAPTVCDQLKAYLRHLAGLAERLPGLRSYVERVRRAKAPLFFALDDTGAAIELSFDAWKAGLPEEWAQLPLNWGRHWCRTYGVELGVPADLVNLQMGHLEAAGYPFSGASPTEPVLVMEHLAPLWDRVIREQGWTVLTGLSGGGDAAESAVSPLADWTDHLAAQRRAHKAAARRWDDLMQSRTRAYREAAEERVLAHPTLVSEGIIARYKQLPLEKPLPPHALSRGDFEDIRDELASAAADPAEALALSHVLQRIVRAINRRTGQGAETPGALAFFRAPIDNAFVPGMMTAVRQVAALREHIASHLAADRSGDWRDVPRASARVLLAIALFGNCADAERIRGAIERRCQLKRSAALPDLVLVPHGDGPHEVLGLRGPAAIALAHMARKLPDAEWPGWEAVEAALEGLLPEWAVSQPQRRPSSLVDRLCQTVAIAQRFELSPGARLALSPSGSVSGSLDQQLSWIDGDPAEADSGALSASDPPVAFDVRKSRVSSRGYARTQYLALCRAFPTPDRDTELPATRYTIASGEAASSSTRKAIVEELRARLAATDGKNRLQPIVAHLTGWVLDMLVNGTSRTKDPALSTIETYLTRIGGLLVEVFGQGAVDVTDEAAFEDAYLTVIEARTRGRADAAAAILAFHRYARHAHDYSDIDLSGVLAHLRGSGEDVPDAVLITPRQRDALLAGLATEMHAAGPELAVDASYRRLVRQAAHAGAVVALTAARRAEALGLQLRDVRRVGQWIRLRMRRNRSRRLKTPNARRYVYLPVGVHADRFAEWVDAERRRHGSGRVESVYLFSTPEAPRRADARSAIAGILLGACRRIAGRPDVRVHGLRHLVGMEQTLPSFLSASDYRALGDHVRLAPEPLVFPVLPRDLAGRVQTLGHGNAQTTLRWYHHLPWLLASRTDAWIARRYVDRRTMAGLLGVTPYAMDAHTRGRRDIPAGLAWLDAQVPRRVRASGGLLQPPTATVRECSAPACMRWTAQQLGRILIEAAAVGSLETAVHQAGGDDRDAERLRVALTLLERRFGWQLTVSAPALPGQRAPLQGFRRLNEGKRFEALWSWYDEDLDWRDRLVAVARAVVHSAKGGDRDAVVLPSAQARILCDALRRLGVEHEQVEVAEAAPGISSVRVYRPRNWSDDGPSGRADGPERGLPHSDVRTRRYLGRSLKWVMTVIHLAAADHGPPDRLDD